MGQVYLLLAIGGVAAIGYVLYFVLVVLRKSAELTERVGSAAIDGVKAASTRRKEKKAELEMASQMLAAAERTAAFEAYRQQDPARILGVPSADAFERAFKAFDGFLSAANAYRPILNVCSDTQFRVARFQAHRYELPRLHPEAFGEVRPMPVKISQVDSVVRLATSVAPLYESVAKGCGFPFELNLSVDTLPPAPKLPAISRPQLPPLRLVFSSSGVDIDENDSVLAEIYREDFVRAAKFRKLRDDLLLKFERKEELAREAADLMEVHIGKVRLRAKEEAEALTAEFLASKARYQRECEQVISSIRSLYAGYIGREPDQIRSHFAFALRAMKLPLPDEMPWQVFYEAEERLLQVNQCVPALADTTVVRLDSKRPPAKRDAEAILRTFVPAIALQIAQQVAENDLNEDVDTIAVNCWSRFFEPSTGNMRDAFVASLVAPRRQIREMNLSRAEPLAAFRALHGTFVFSVQDVVPIEPQIRLDKSDTRFVVGRPILDGMVQDQNLATMDWQDFEHLIRELFAKEFATGNSEVMITRASRDRGVDAVVFNPDPIHGGKLVIQAKRYSSTVDVAAVRELYGTVMSEGANRGIIVTTSHFGRDAHEWAANKPLTLLDGQNLLALLAKHGYNFKIGV